jgi:hypothetical protein
MAGAGGFNPHAWNAAMRRAGQAVFDGTCQAMAYRGQPVVTENRRASFIINH